MEDPSFIIEFLISTKLPIFTLLPILVNGLKRAEGPIEEFSSTSVRYARQQIADTMFKVALKRRLLDLCKDIASEG